METDASDRFHHAAVEERLSLTQTSAQNKPNESMFLLHHVGNKFQFLKDDGNKFVKMRSYDKKREKTEADTAKCQTINGKSTN